MFHLVLRRPAALSRLPAGSLVDGPSITQPKAKKRTGPNPSRATPRLASHQADVSVSRRRVTGRPVLPKRADMNGFRHQLPKAPANDVDVEAGTFPPAPLKQDHNRRVLSFFVFFCVGWFVCFWCLSVAYLLSLTSLSSGATLMWPRMGWSRVLRR